MRSTESFYKALIYTENNQITLNQFLNDEKLNFYFSTLEKES
jgi:hypothetical protein